MVPGCETETARGGGGSSALERFGDAAQRSVRGAREIGNFGAAAEHAVSRLPYAGGAGTRRLRGFIERRAHRRCYAAGGDRYTELRRLAGFGRLRARRTGGH